LVTTIQDCAEADSKNICVWGASVGDCTGEHDDQQLCFNCCQGTV